MAGDNDNDIELLHFCFSHYNEKARWALDWKGVPHTRTSYLPGLHMKPVMKLTGQRKTPVVRFGDTFVSGSANILAALEERFPNPALYPADPADRARALEVQRYFDEEIGPRIRRPVLEACLQDGTYLASVFAADKGAGTRLAYKLLMPVAKGKVRAGNGITGPETIEDGIRGTEEGLDFIANNRDGDFLVGDRFSIADLTAASILAPAVDPPGSPMERPHPRPATVTAWLDSWTDHPGAAWVNEMYRNYRSAGSSASTS